MMHALAQQFAEMDPPQQARAIYFFICRLRRVYADSLWGRSTSRRPTRRSPR
jgi:hypothetical protein